MPKYLTIRFDVTELSDDQIERLKYDAFVQGKSNRNYCDDSKAVRPSVDVDEVCPFCSQIREHGQCGGEGEGVCIEFLCVESYNPSTRQDVTAHVAAFCEEYSVEDSIVPYRNDGLTYHQQLAYMVANYHDIAQSVKS